MTIVTESKQLNFFLYPLNMSGAGTSSCEMVSSVGKGSTVPIKHKVLCITMPYKNCTPLLS